MYPTHPIPHPLLLKALILSDKNDQRVLRSALIPTTVNPSADHVSTQHALHSILAQEVIGNVRSKF